MKIKSLLIVAVLAVAFLCFGGVASAQVDTQALIAQLQAQIASLIAQIQALQAQQGGTATQLWCHTFNTNLGFVNSNSDEVGALHAALQKEGFSSEGDNINTYGEDTAAEVVQFQQKYGITPLSGYVGPKTRAKLNLLYGCALTPQIQQNICTPNWSCSGFGACINGSQTRTCVDLNNCTIFIGEPNIIQPCVNTSLCAEGDWSYYLSPNVCPSSGIQNKIWTQVGNCQGGITHPSSETISCNYQVLTCTSWTYSDWSACSASGTQTRTVISALPANCAGGSPTTSQTCTYIPLCTGSNWTSTLSPITCPSSGNQTKTWTKIGNCTGGTTHPATETATCNYSAPTCTSWTYSSWSPTTCPSSGTQTRTVISALPANCAGGSPVTSQSCTYVPPFSNETSSWTREGVILSNFYNLYNPHIIIDSLDSSYKYKMWFFGWAVAECTYDPVTKKYTNNGFNGCDAIYYARSLDGKQWQVYSGTQNGNAVFDSTMNSSKWVPVVTAGNSYFDQAHNGDPSVVKVGNNYYMVFSSTGNDLDGIAPGQPGDTDGEYDDIMGAVSSDGINWTKSNLPILAYSGEVGNPDPPLYGWYARPSLMYENGKFKLWFDYWAGSNLGGVSLGYAELSGTANTSDFLSSSGKWNLIKGGANPALQGWPNSDVIHVNNTYYTYADPPYAQFISPDCQTNQQKDVCVAYTARKISEAVSSDGINWTVTGYIDPDSDCAATHVPEAYYENGRIYLAYACQNGGDPYDYKYKSIRRMYKGVTTSFNVPQNNLASISGALNRIMQEIKLLLGQ